MRSMKGKYVLFEGPDGSGKTTLAKMLASALILAGQSGRSFSFPGRESVVGNLIRDSFEGKAKISPEAMMWLFVAEGKDLEPQVRKHLKDGDWIVCDRHTMVSGRVYQGEVHGTDRVDAVTAPAHFTVPDRIYLVDVPAQVAMERRKNRGEARNVLYEPEQITRLDDMCRAYRMQREHFVTSTLVDGTKPLDENVRWIWKDLGLPGEPIL